MFNHSSHQGTQMKINCFSPKKLAKLHKMLTQCWQRYGGKGSSHTDRRKTGYKFYREELTMPIKTF